MFHSLPIPSWLHPATCATPTFFLCLAGVYWLILLGGEWMNDALCTLGLAMKAEPLFVGLVVTTLIGVVPLLTLVGVMSATAQPQVALGMVLGAGWGLTLLPMALAGLTVPVGNTDRWVRVDLPLFVTYTVIFALMFGLEGQPSPWQSLLLVAVAGVYLVFRYLHGVECRYGLSSFGRNFIFGASVGNTIIKFALGALWLGLGCWLLYLFAGAAGARWHLPSLPLGLFLALPLCLPEVIFALSAMQRGQGELILGRGLGLATLVVLLGGWMMQHYRVEVDPHDINVAALALIVGLLVLWGFLRSSQRLWKWQAGVLLWMGIACLALICLQSWGFLTFLQLPRVIDLQ